MVALTAISWGCGVQSTTLAVMAALGDLDPVDVVITADTHWERRATYQARDYYTDYLRERGIRVEIVSAGNIRHLGAEQHIHMPFWTATGAPLNRQCTKNFKIVPVKHRLREIAGYHANHPPHPPVDTISLWLGISWDEFTRMKHSRVQFITHRWPLIEKRMTRQDCITYLTAHRLPIPPKSACVACPYRQSSSWIDMRDNAPDDWHEALAFDEANRHNPLAARGRTTADHLFVYHRACPLGEANLEADAAREKSGTQPPLFICEEGYCLV